MALVEKYVVVAAVKAVKAEEVIKEGMFVALDSSGRVVKQKTEVPYGVAGDTKSTSASAMPGIASGWQNRASDYFDETKASAKMTVYHSGGEFATDQFAANVATGSVTPFTALYAHNGLLCTTAESNSSGIVAYMTQAPGAYPSGVPGVDTTTYDYATYVGDQALGGDNTNQYIEFKLVI